MLIMPWSPGYLLAGSVEEFRRAENERAALGLDSPEWRNAAVATLVTMGPWAVLRERSPGMLLCALWQAAVFQALSLLAARRPAVYARHRELVTSIGQMFFSIYFVRTGLLSRRTIFESHFDSGPWLLFLLLIANGSIWILCSVLISRLLWRWNCVLLPLLTAPQVAYAAPLCRVVLTAPGVEAPLDRVYHWLNLAHGVIAPPLLKQELLAPAPATPLQQCATVHTHSMLAVLVALPLVALWPLELRARRRFYHQQHSAAAGPSAAAAGEAAASAAALSTTAAAAAVAQSTHAAAEAAVAAAAAAAAEEALEDDPAWVLHAQLGILYLLSCTAWALARALWVPLAAS